MRILSTALLLAFPLLAQEPTPAKPAADKPAANAAEAIWLTNFEAAKAQAKEQKKVILADFTGSDWCGWCIKLKNEVFSKPEFAEWAAKNVVLLELDYPRKTAQDAAVKQQNAELAKRYGIRGYPTILFLDAEGKEVAKHGYQPGGPAAWTAKADEMLKGGASGEAGTVTDTASQEGWMTDYQAALTQAKKEKKAVLANFTGSDWCGWCIKLKDEVFSTPEFKAWAEKNVVLVEVDFPRKKKLSKELTKQNQKLAEEFGIQGYPTILLIDAKGKLLGQMGYEKGGPAAWLPLADKELAKKSKK